MGTTVDREHFSEQEYRRFGERLQENLRALASLLERPGFGTGPVTLGAELELFLVDDEGRSLPLNRTIQAEAADPRVTLEIDRFNLELNLTPVPLSGRPFSAFGAELTTALALVRSAARAHDGRVATIGILPTLRTSDLRAGAISDSLRYRALNNGLRRLRQEPFRIRIDGDDPLELIASHVALEGANTSLQVHLRVDPAEFARTYNAVQLATGPVLAVAGNSPTFLGHALWEETRVALFKQAVDDRAAGDRAGRRARVAFGTGWVRAGALELFEDSVRHHEPVLPMLGAEDPAEQMRLEQLPSLEELRLHQGTVWSWNRAIYDPAAGGHLRIEMRALPAGPSVTDMLANAAFLVGLALALAPDAHHWLPHMPFERVHRDFYAAARRGLSAELVWPFEQRGRAAPLPAAELVLRLLPVAGQALEQAGVAGDEAARLLAVIEARARTRQTGAAWQRRTVASLEPVLGRERALEAMLERYLEHSTADAPVHTWPVPGPPPSLHGSRGRRGSADTSAGPGDDLPAAELSWAEGLGTVADAMATDVLVMDAAWTVREAASRLRAAHVAGGPVVTDGRLVGVVTMRDLLRWTRSETVEVYAPVEYVEQRQSWLPGLVGEAATEEVVCARPDWSLQRAVAVMRMAGVRRLPVVDDDGRLVGVVGYEVVEGIARYLRRRHAGAAAAQAPGASEPRKRAISCMD